MKQQQKNPPPPNVVRLRIDDEAFDAIPLKNGDYKVVEVVLSDLCTYGDLVKADETGRVVAVIKGPYETFVTFCDSEAEAQRVAKDGSVGRASRVLLGTIVLSATKSEAMDFQTSQAKGRMRCPYRDAWGVVKLPIRKYVMMSPLDAVRTELYAMRKFQNDRRLVDNTRLGNWWPLWMVQEMLTATLTEESALPIEYSHR